MTFWKNTYLQGFLLLIIIGLMFLPIPLNNLWWHEAFDTGHTFVFMAFSYLLTQRLAVKKPFSNIIVIYLVVLVIVMLTGAAVELVQGEVGRETSWGDLQNDLLGASAGLALFHAARLDKSSEKRSEKRRAVFYMLTASALLLFSVLSFMQLSLHYVQRDRAFPVIADLASGWTKSFVRYNKARLLSEGSEHAEMSVVEFLPGVFPGISIIEPEKDWTGYEYLRFKIFSRHEGTINFVIRIHDQWHDNRYIDRFNQRLTIDPGLNDIVIKLEDIRNAPLQRQLDMLHIAGVTLFLIRLEERSKFEISKLYLE